MEREIKKSTRLLIGLHRELIFRQTSVNDAEPEAVKLADQLLRTVIEYERVQAHIQQQQAELGHAERKLRIAEQKAAQTKGSGAAQAANRLTPEEREERIKEIYGR